MEIGNLLMAFILGALAGGGLMVIIYERDMDKLHRDIAALQTTLYYKRRKLDKLKGDR